MPLTGFVSKTYIAPVKGMQMIETPTRGICTDSSVGVKGDRVLAFGRKNDMQVTGWEPKGKFYVAMNTQGAAQYLQLTEADLDENFRLKPSGYARLLATNAVTSADKHKPMSVVMVPEDSGFNLQDRRHPYVSFVNMASVRDLSNFLGIELDERRFRMNVAVEGLPAWIELEKFTVYSEPERYPMRIGSAALGVRDLCTRCRAIDQNPLTGDFDIELNKHLADYVRNVLKYSGSPHDGQHSVMGWLAIPDGEYTIKAGTTCTF